MFNKFISLSLSSLLALSLAGCSLVEENISAPSPAVSVSPEVTQEPTTFTSATAPTGFAFDYNSNEFIYRLTAYIGADNENREKAFEDLKIDSSEFFTETLENGLISTTGIHEIDGESAFSFVINADKDGKVFDIALIMYPSFMAKKVENGNLLYPYLVTYTVCAALECEATKATSIIVDLMSKDNKVSDGMYSFESENIFYNFVNSSDSSALSISAGGEGLFIESMK